MLTEEQKREFERKIALIRQSQDRTDYRLALLECTLIKTGEMIPVIVAMFEKKNEYLAEPLAILLTNESLKEIQPPEGSKTFEKKDADKKSVNVSRRRNGGN